MNISQNIPYVTITINTDITEFLKEMELLAKERSEISETKAIWGEIERKNRNEFSIVSFKPKNQKGNICLNGQLSNSLTNKKHIEIDIHGIDDFTEKEYLAHIQEIIKPLLQIYNKKHCKKLRITNHNKKTTKPYKLPLGANDLFRKIASSPSMSHPSDKIKFYKFVKYCHRYQVKLSGFQLKVLLLKEGFTEEMSDELQIVYTCGRKILAVSL